MQFPLILKNPLTSLLGSKCYTSLIENLNIFDASCRNLAISKGLGLGIVIGGSIVKVPQVLKIVNARSAEGLSLASSILETSGYIISLAYNVRAGNPFSTYGETMFIAIQNVIILSLIFFYTNRSLLGYLIPLIYLGASMVLADATMVGATNMSYLQISTIPIVAFSRAPQIYQNWKNGSTGQLSAFTVFMFFAGAMARIFTTMQEVDDNLILLGFVLGAFFNGILLFQMVLYWNSKPKKSSVSPKKQRVRKID